MVALAPAISHGTKHVRAGARIAFCQLLPHYHARRALADANKPLPWCLLFRASRHCLILSLISRRFLTHPVLLGIMVPRVLLGARVRIYRNCDSWTIPAP